MKRSWAAHNHALRDRNVAGLARAALKPKLKLRLRARRLTYLRAHCFLTDLLRDKLK